MSGSSGALAWSRSQALRPPTARQQTVVPDADIAGRQDMLEKPARKFFARQLHRLDLSLTNNNLLRKLL